MLSKYMIAKYNFFKSVFQLQSSSVAHTSAASLGRKFLFIQHVNLSYEGFDFVEHKFVHLVEKTAYLHYSGRFNCVFE